MDDQINPQQPTRSPVQGSINLNEQPLSPQSSNLFSTPPETPPQTQKKRSIVRIVLIVFSVLFFVIIGILVFITTRQTENQEQNTTSPTPLESKRTPSPQQVPQTIVFTDSAQRFTFEYNPETIVVEEQSSVWINNTVNVVVSSYSTDECRGDCPVVKSVQERQIGMYNWTVYTGEIGAVGGSIPQSVIIYELASNGRYFKVWVYEILRTASEPIDRNSQAVQPQVIEMTEEILQTFSILSPTTAISDNDGSALFRSDRLGIQFRYLPELNGTEIIVEEVGNKVFIYPKELGRDGGQWVEVFEKKADQTIGEAITEQFLTGKDPARCFVGQIEKPETSTTRGLWYEISYPFDEDMGYEDSWKKTEYCGPDYAMTNGIRYFWYEQDNPTKYLFFSIGQYAIMVGDEFPWQDTIEIIN